MKKNNKIKKITGTEKRFKRLFSKRYILGLVALILVVSGVTVFAAWTDNGAGVDWTDNKVRIGTTDPDSAYRLEVEQHIRIIGHNPLINFDHTNAVNGATQNFTIQAIDSGLRIYDHGHARESLIVYSTGMNLFGTMNAANYACFSDRRYKKEILPLHDSLKKVLSLQGVSYFWKKDEFKDKNFNDKKEIGFVAQDMEKVFPELVYTGEDGYKSVNYQKMTAVLVEAVKELNSNYSKKITALEEENNSLKQKVASLEKMNARVAALEKRLDRVGMVSVK